MRRRALLSAGKGKEESPYAFYFNIELNAGEVWTATAEQLVEINKMFAIIFQVVGDRGDANPETMPPEFDLRVNGERNYWGFYTGGNDETDVYITFYPPIGSWFGYVIVNYHNPVIDSFVLTPLA